MKPSDIRKKVLADHRMLGGMLSSLEDLAKDVLNGQHDESGALCERGEGLLDHLGEHMQWEERYLAPAIRAADSWGEERARRLFDDHREQRILLEHALIRLRDPVCPAVLLAGNLLDLAALIRDDMIDEERRMLDVRVLRDDVIVIDTRAG